MARLVQATLYLDKQLGVTAGLLHIGRRVRTLGTCCCLLVGTASPELAGSASGFRHRRPAFGCTSGKNHHEQLKRGIPNLVICAVGVVPGSESIATVVLGLPKLGHCCSRCEIDQ